MFPAAKEEMLAPSIAARSDEEIFFLAAGVDAAALETQQGANAVRGKKTHQGIFSKNRRLRVGATRAKWSGTHQDSGRSWWKIVVGSAIDANGNTLSDPSGKSFTWDFENRMVQAVVPGTGTVTFKYDPFGRRIQKSGPLGTTNYLYDWSDASANVIEEVDNTGNVVARYSQGTDVDEQLTMFRSSTLSFYQRDGLGSVTSLSNTAGTLANTYTYDSFGNLTASSGTLTNPFQYTGRESDSETGIKYYRARYYDSIAGRFLGEDPLRFAVGGNFYPYVQNNPVGHIDPSGLCPCGYHRVKLYLNSYDYHWYRQDWNFGWSSKHGWMPVGPQVNPAMDAFLTGYTVYCGSLCAKGGPPTYNPSTWNDPNYTYTNNCYSYACNRLYPPGPPGKPQPGQSMGYFPGLNCTDLMNAAMMEGATPDSF